MTNLRKVFSPAAVFLAVAMTALSPARAHAGDPNPSPETENVDPDVAKVIGDMDKAFGTLNQLMVGMFKVLTHSMGETERMMERTAGEMKRQMKVDPSAVPGGGHTEEMHVKITTTVNNGQTTVREERIERSSGDATPATLHFDGEFPLHRDNRVGTVVDLDRLVGAGGDPELLDWLLNTSDGNDAACLGRMLDWANGSGSETGSSSSIQNIDDIKAKTILHLMDVAAKGPKQNLLAFSEKKASALYFNAATNTISFVKGLPGRPFISSPGSIAIQTVESVHMKKDGSLEQLDTEQGNKAHLDASLQILVTSMAGFQPQDGSVRKPGDSSFNTSPRPR